MHNSNRFGLDRGDSVVGGSGGSGDGGAKRPFEDVGDDVHRAASGSKRQKLPALASVVVEAVKMDSLQKLCSSLEPLLRKVVGEEVERALARLVPNRLGTRTPPRQIQESPMSDLRLDFTNKLSLPLFTGGKVEGEGGLPIHIVLKDASTDQIITSGPESNTKLEVVVLDGDFANEDDEWTSEEFEANVVKERDGKRPLLTGDLNVILKEGVGTLGDLTFTDNSSWIRSRKFRLGVRIAPGFWDGVRIRECKTDAFTVKDHRGELYKKHYPPLLNDEVWRLDKIGKDGAFHKRLQQKNINTVEDFLRCYVMDSQGLRNTLGSGMSNKMWEATIDHAKTCVLSGKLYVYYPNAAHTVGVIFNNIYELLGITTNNTYKSIDSITEKEKVYVDKLVKAAYENWSTVVTEYENPTLASRDTSKRAAMHDETESSNMSKEQALMYTESVGVPQLVKHHQSIPVASSIPATSMTQHLYGYGAETTSQFPNQDNMIRGSELYNMGTDPPSNVHANINFQSALAPGIEHANTGLGLGTSQALVPRPYGSYSVPQSQQGFQGTSAEWQRVPAHNPMTPAVDLYFHEEDIRARALELLGNEDMQQLLRLQYSSHPENLQLPGEDTYFPATFTPSPSVSFNEDGGRSSGKAYVGWLKLKAALRWGIFIRKIAADKKAVRRAQLQEIEDGDEGV